MPGVRLPRGVRAVAGGLAAVLLVGAGCAWLAGDDSGGDSGGDPRASQPDDAGDGQPGQPSSAACEAPALPSPPAEATVLAADCVELVLDAGEEHVVDGDATVRENGQQAPTCAAFGSYFSWQVTDTPPEPVALTAVRQGSSHELAEGASGDAPGMCGTVTVTNRGSDSASLDLRYVFLDCEPTGRAC